MKQKENKFPEGFPLGRRFGLLMRLYFGALTKKLEQLDIDRHYSVLLLIESADVHCNQQYLSDILNIDKTAMVRMIDYLVEKGYIVRAVNPADRRAHRIQLTSKAKKALPRIHKAIDDLNGKATKGISSRKLKQFYADLNTVAENLTHEPRHTFIMNFEKVKSVHRK
jgi:MarR family transcriptional regulator for hemolysin